MEVKSPIVEFAVQSPGMDLIELARNHSKEFFGPDYLKTSNERNETFFTTAQFGCLTGLLIIILSNYQNDKEKCLKKIWFRLKSSSSREWISVTFCFMVALLLMPSTLLIFMGFKIFKLVDGLKVQKLEAENFKGFMNGEDVVWACEDSVSKSIINILAYVRGSSTSDLNFTQNILNSIRDRISTKIIEPNRFPKMFYRRRKSDSGYHYWTDENPLSITDYVRFTEEIVPQKPQNEDEFKNKMSEISNQPLPANNTALWECLIGQQVKKAGDDMKVPVIFRVHHAVGDGVALIRLLLETLADKEELDAADKKSLSIKSSEKISEMLTRVAINLATFVKMPYFLVRMAMKKVDVNRIHPEVLTGCKKVNWLYESDANATGSYPTLLTAVKLLKRQFDGARFSSILLAALSKSLWDFFEQRNCDVPKEMTVVIPARLCTGYEDPELRLENKFSVAMQTLPIDIKRTDERVKQIKNNSDIISSSPDYLVNYWIMSQVAAIFPDWILKVVMYSKHSTMAISNLPGPNFAIKIDGHEFENVGFFLPNLGRTACGLTILSYNNKLHFGIMADEAAIGSEEDLGEILNGMVREIKDMMDSHLK